MAATLNYLVIAVRPTYERATRKEYKRLNNFTGTALGKEVAKIQEHLPHKMSHFRFDTLPAPNKQYENMLEGRIRYMRTEMQKHLKNQGINTKGVHYYRLYIDELPEQEILEHDQFTISLTLGTLHHIVGFSFQSITLQGETTYPVVHAAFTTSNDNLQPKYDDTRYIDSKQGEVVQVEYTNGEIEHYFSKGTGKLSSMAGSNTGWNYRQLVDFNYDKFAWSEALPAKTTVLTKNRDGEKYWKMFEGKEISKLSVLRP